MAGVEISMSAWGSKGGKQRGTVDTWRMVVWHTGFYWETKSMMNDCSI